MPSRKITVQLIGDSDSLERAFQRSQRKGDQFGKSMGLAGIPLKSFAKAGAAGAAAGGLALVTKQLFSSVNAAKEAQVAQVKLRQALGSAGKSYRLYGKQVDLAIQRTSKLAGIDDELVSDSFANLIRTSGSVSKAMKGIALAADIARARNISLESATKIVERTLNGQFLSLRRVGVQVDKNMTSTEALDAAHRKFAGSAEAYGKTAAGAQEKLAVAWENAQEKIGTKLLPILTKLSLKLVTLIEWAEKNWPKFSKAVSDVWAKVKPVFEAFRSYFDGWVKIIQGIIEGDWALVWAGVKKAVVAGLNLVFEYLKAVPARLFKFGFEMGKKLAAGVLAGIGNLAADIANKIIPGGPGTGGDKILGGRTGTTTATPAPTGDGVRGKRGSGKDPRAPGRALGGPVRAGVPYIVGERGPELRVFNKPGKIIPSGKFGTGGISIGVVHVHGVQNVRELVSEIQRLSRHGVAQQRGQHGGTNLALT